MIWAGWASQCQRRMAASAFRLPEAVPVVEQMGRKMMATPFVATTLAAQAILIGRH